jgi:uncharacterized membrane protein
MGECEGGSGGNQWYFGVIISIAGSLCMNLGQNIQKFAANVSLSKSTRGDKLQSYYKQWRWWGGLGFVIFGSCGDFIALYFAPQSIVMPMGAFTLIANLFFASAWLGEKLVVNDVIGTVCIVFGGIGIAVAYGIIGETKCDEELSTTDLLNLWAQWHMLAYVMFVVGLATCLYMVMRHCEEVMENKRLGQEIQSAKPSHSYERLHPLSYAALSGIFGGHSALFAKSTVEMLSSTFDGNNQFNKPITYVFIACMLVCVVSQVNKSRSARAKLP